MFGNVKVSQTLTDFMPYRIAANRGTHPSYGFYGHQWNFIGLSYQQFYHNSTTSPNQSHNRFAMTVNGKLVNPVGNPNFNPGGASTPSDAPIYLDHYWEEASYHGQEDQPSGELEYEHFGEGYMRLGWCSESGGPVSDSTYDEVTAWKHYMPAASFSSLWNGGRYNNTLLDDPAGNNTSCIALYTSPTIDLHKELKSSMGSHRTDSLKIRSASWTVHWPRYNWRPDISASPDWRLWPTATPFDAFTGIDLHTMSTNPPETDPVTGKWDVVTVDIRGSQSADWMFSQDNNVSDINLFNSMDTMLSVAGGAGLPASQTCAVSKNDLFQYRVYFHQRPGVALVESPIFDDITFTVTAGRPIVYYWELS
jgi:hypothetical protein